MSAPGWVFNEREGESKSNGKTLCDIAVCDLVPFQKKSRDSVRSVWIVLRSLSGHERKGISYD